jgi:hypothetical protein
MTIQDYLEREKSGASVGRVEGARDRARAARYRRGIRAEARMGPRGSWVPVDRRETGYRGRRDVAVIEIERIQERRRAVRVEENGRAYVTEKKGCSPIPGMDESLAPLFGRTLNLSETGVLLELEESMMPGRRVVLGLELDGAEVELAAVVARVCRPRGVSRVHIGLRFVDLDEGLRDRILRLVAAGKFAPYLN